MHPVYYYCQPGSERIEGPTNKTDIFCKIDREMINIKAQIRKDLSHSHPSFTSDNFHYINLPLEGNFTVFKVVLKYNVPNDFSV